MLSTPRPSLRLCPRPAPFFLIAILLCLSAWTCPARGAHLELAPEISLDIPDDWHIVVAPPAPSALEALKDGEELTLLEVSANNNRPWLSASAQTLNEGEGEDLRQALIKYRDYSLKMWHDMLYEAFTSSMEAAGANIVETLPLRCEWRDGYPVLVAEVVQLLENGERIFIQMRQIVCGNRMLVILNLGSMDERQEYEALMEPVFASLRLPEAHRVKDGDRAGTVADFEPEVLAVTSFTSSLYGVLIWALALFMLLRTRKTTPLEQRRRHDKPGGFLLLYIVLSSVFTPLNGIRNLYELSSGIGQDTLLYLLRYFKGEPAWSDMHSLYLFQLLNCVSIVLLVFLALYQGWLLWKVRPGALRAAKIYLAAQFLLNLFLLLAFWRILGPDRPIVAATVAQSGMFALLWLTYLGLSLRVEDTYSKL